jgi:serine protease Do
MIRKTLQATKAATFSVELPTTIPPKRVVGSSGPVAIGFQGPMPCGTGFFISPDGWFLTAAHVIAKPGTQDIPRDDLESTILHNEATKVNHPGADYQVRLDHFDPSHDFALLKFDAKAIEGTQTNEPLDFIEVSDRVLEEGEAVYSFGYPLSDFPVLYP